jgi:hypothetical protein
MTAPQTPNDITALVVIGILVLLVLWAMVLKGQAR